MYGGYPRNESFVNTRPGGHIKPVGVKPVGGFTSVDDPTDARLYEAAKEIFVSRLSHYGFDVPIELQNNGLKHAAA